VSGDGRPARQEISAHRDAYVAGRDIHIHQAAPEPHPRRRVWGNVPARNPDFTGREELLRAVRAAHVSGDRAVVQALHGMGGVGKTQLAVEYAHRFADEYEIVWWVAAEHGEIVGEQFAALADELGCAQLGAPLPVIRRAVLGKLREYPTWLLVFDNAEDPEVIADWLPGGSGDVLITSRTAGWRGVAVPVEVGVLDRPESAAILRGWVDGLSDADAGLVAEAVGDLPLALAQAAGFMAQTGMPAAEYAGLLAERAAEILDLGRPATYPLSLAAATQIAFDHLRSRDPAAVGLTSICAFLAPEPVPAEWFPRAAGRLPGALGERAADPVAWRGVLGQLSRDALVRVDRDGLVMHRLTQAVIRGHLPASQSSAARDLAVAVVTASHPGPTHEPGNWPGWARVLPHLLSLEPGDTSDPRLRDLAFDAGWYLLRRGDFRAAHDLASHLHERWRARLGPDHPAALMAANTLGTALRGLGDYAKAALLDRESLERERRLHGDDAPNTLVSATNLATDLFNTGDYAGARQLYQDALARYRRTLGEDHPLALGAARGLAICLRRLGEAQAARELNEDTLERYRRVLGADYYETLRCATNLANDLYRLRDYAAARDLQAATMDRQRLVLGEDHPDALYSAFCLAYCLRALGEPQAARDLDQDTLERRRRVLGDDHPDTLLSARNLAVDRRMLGETA
jgi:tetratricopeptide (TPR) repeat protein